VVGVTTNCNFPPEAKGKQKIGGFFLNLEKVVSLKPDLVIMQEDAQQKDIKRFKDFGLPVYTINPRSVEDVIDSLVELGRKTGAEKEARTLAAKKRARINSVEARVKNYKPSLLDVLQLWSPKTKQRKALVIVGFNPLIVAGGGTFIDDILKHAGVENVAERSKAAYPQYSFEKLVEENPPYIIIAKGLVTKGQIEREKRWRGLDAVKEHRILFIDQDIISRPGPRVIYAIEKIAEFVYD
jgi:iron complex transport system substrate-binding protein